MALAALFLAPLALAGAADAKPAAATSAAPKTHVLFMGADLAVERDKAFRPVEAVSGSALVIQVGGKTQRVAQSPDLKLQIKEALKISAASVGVENLKTERVYTPEADPFRRVAQAAALAAGDSAVADLKQNAAMWASMSAAPLNAGAEAVRGTPSEASAAAAAATANAQAAEAQAGAFGAFNTTTSDVANVGSSSIAAGAEAGREMFDAIRVTFELKPEKDLKDAYYAVIAQIREPGSKPGHVRKWAYVKSLPELTAGEVKKVTAYQGGMPPGFIIESCDVHLYNRGAELATSSARKRVPLTADEAFQFDVVDYLGRHKAETRPAAIATAHLDRSRLEGLPRAQPAHTYYIAVGKDGMPTAVFRDAAGRRTLDDPRIESALKAMRFLPAVDAGKPVASIYPLKLDEIEGRSK